MTGRVDRTGEGNDFIPQEYLLQQAADGNWNPIDEAEANSIDFIPRHDVRWLWVLIFSTEKKNESTEGVSRTLDPRNVSICSFMDALTLRFSILSGRATKLRPDIVKLSRGYQQLSQNEPPHWEGVDSLLKRLTTQAELVRGVKALKAPRTKETYNNLRDELERQIRSDAFENFSGDELIILDHLGEIHPLLRDACLREFHHQTHQLRVHSHKVTELWNEFQKTNADFNQKFTAAEGTMHNPGMIRRYLIVPFQSWVSGSPYLSTEDGYLPPESVTKSLPNAPLESPWKVDWLETTAKIYSLWSKNSKELPPGFEATRSSWKNNLNEADRVIKNVSSKNGQLSDLIEEIRTLSVGLDCASEQWRKNVQERTIPEMTKYLQEIRVEIFPVDSLALSTGELPPINTLASSTGELPPINSLASSTGELPPINSLASSTGELPPISLSSSTGELHPAERLIRSGVENAPLLDTVAEICTLLQLEQVGPALNRVDQELLAHHVETVGFTDKSTFNSQFEALVAYDTSCKKSLDELNALQKNLRTLFKDAQENLSKLKALAQPTASSREGSGDQGICEIQ